MLDSRQLALDLHIPENAPAGMAIPRLTMAVGRPLMPSGQLRGDLFLRPLHIVNERTIAAGGIEIDVQALDVRFAIRSTVDVQLAWTTREALSQNYKASLIAD